MKIRMGFVPNSSSSSFIVLVSDENKSREELFAENTEKFIKMYGKSEVNEEYIQKKINELCDNAQYIYYMTQIEHGAEDDTEKLVRFFMDKLGMKYSVKWEE